MTDRQLNHFMSLPEEDKYIINVGALIGSSITVSSVADIVQSKIKVTQKHIKECLDEAIAFTLFHSTTSYGGRIEYEVNLSFAIELYPFLKDYQKEWKIAPQNRNPVQNTPPGGTLPSRTRLPTVPTGLGKTGL